MICPYCGKEMTHGGIAVRRDNLYWYPLRESDYGVTLPEDKGILLGKPGFLDESYIMSEYCEACRMLIAPVPELETVTEKLGKKWDELTHKVSEQYEQRTAQYAQQQKEKKREERRKKDPWEVD